MARTGKLTEEGIQAAVWHIELGRGKTVIRWGLLTLLALGLGLLYTACQFHGLAKREALDQAQLARNLARGQGFTTFCIRPLSLWRLQNFSPNHDARLMHHPDLQNPPLYPSVLAGLFKLLPARLFHAGVLDYSYAPERLVILPFSQLCLLLTVLLVYFWAKQLFDQRVAVTTGLLLLFSDMLWQYGISGLAINFLMLLFGLALYCLFLADRRLNHPEMPTAEQAVPAVPGRAVVGLVLASAVLFGLCFLTRYLAVVLLPAVAVYLGRIFRGRRAAVWVTLYVLVFVAVITPWLVRNQRLAGNPLGTAVYELINDGSVFGGDSLPRSLHPDRDGQLARAYGPHHFTGKFIRMLREHQFGSMGQLSCSFLVFFFAVGVMKRFRRGDLVRLRGAVVAGLICAVLGMGIIGVTHETADPQIHGDDLLALFWPLVALFGVVFFYLLLDQINFRMRLTRGAAIGLFALLNVGPLILTLLPPRSGPFAYPPYMPPVTCYVAQMFDGDDLGCSDLPWAMAWNGDRRTVWLPMTVKDFSEINDYFTPKGVHIKFLMLTSYMLDRPLESGLFHGEYQGWSSIIGGKLPGEFPLRAVQSLPPAESQFLFADKPRWSEAATIGPPLHAASANTNAVAKPTAP